MQKKQRALFLLRQFRPCLFFFLAFFVVLCFHWVFFFLVMRQHAHAHKNTNPTRGRSRGRHREDHKMRSVDSGSLKARGKMPRPLQEKRTKAGRARSTIARCGRRERWHRRTRGDDERERTRGRHECVGLVRVAARQCKSGSRPGKSRRALLCLFLPAPSRRTSAHPDERSPSPSLRASPRQKETAPVPPPFDDKKRRRTTRK